MTETLRKTSRRLRKSYKKTSPHGGQAKSALHSLKQKYSMKPLNVDFLSPRRFSKRESGKLGVTGLTRSKLSLRPVQDSEPTGRLSGLENDGVNSKIDSIISKVRKRMSSSSSRKFTRSRDANQTESSQVEEIMSQIFARGKG